MPMKPIKTKREYEAALAQIESLMDAMPNTVECNRLYSIAKIVESYENRRYPVGKPCKSKPLSIEQRRFLRYADDCNIA